MAFLRIQVICLCVLTSAGCLAPVSPASDGTTRVISVKSNADTMSSLLFQQASAEYRALTLQTFAAAKAALAVNIGNAKANAAPNDGEAAPNSQLAVVVDIDETMLDNSPYQARVIATGEPYDETTWQLWTRERSAREVPGAADFARFAASLKNADGSPVSVFYISNRDAGWTDGNSKSSTIEADTVENLTRLGFPNADADHLLLRGEKPNWRDKDARRQHVVSSGYRIVLNVGDQLSDFSDKVKRGTPAERERWRAVHCAMFGTLWFLLPNSVYGSFDDALYDQDRSLSDEAKRNRRARFLDLRGAPGLDPKTDPMANAHCP